MSICRKPYPSDVGTEEWSLVAPYLLLQREDAGQQEHDLREVFNGLRFIVKTGAPWRWMPNDLPPWAAVYQQTQRWLAGCFEAMVDDLRAVLRLAAGRTAEPTAVIIDSRTLHSSPESGERAGYDGGKRKNGSKIHMAVDTLGHLLALHVTPASAEDRGEVERLARTVQAVTGDAVELAWVDQGHTGERAANAAATHGIALEVVKLPKARRIQRANDTPVILAGLGNARSTLRQRATIRRRPAAPGLKRAWASMVAGILSQVRLDPASNRVTPSAIQARRTPNPDRRRRVDLGQSA